MRTVFRLASFSAAAEALDVQQSTVSYTIDRLRKALGDPLIIRQGGRNVPTERCRDLIPAIERLLAEADRLEHPDDFDPGNATGEVRIETASTVASTLMPAVFRRIHHEAPGLSLKISLGNRDVATPILEGRADLALVYQDRNEKGLYVEPALITDYPVCIMDPDNPLVGKTLTIKDLSKARHVGARLWSDWRQPYIVAAENMGAEINEALTVTDQLSVPDLIRGTALIGGMPSQLARAFGNRIGIAYFPFKIDVTMNLYWSAASNRSPLNSWLRGIICEEAHKMNAQELA